MKRFTLAESPKDDIIGHGLRIVCEAKDSLEGNTKLIFYPVAVGQTVALEWENETYYAEIIHKMEINGSYVYQFKLLPTMTKDGEAYLVIGTEPNNARNIQNLIPEHEASIRMFVKPVEIPLFNEQGKFVGEIGIQGIRLRGDHLSFIHVSYRHGNMNEAKVIPS